MSTRDIKELALMTISQCREKLITLIKECGDMDNLNIRIKLQSDEFDVVATIRSSSLTKISSMSKSSSQQGHL